MDIIKVAGSSRTSSVAGAIAGVFRENHRAEVQAIGAGAVNQAVKAMVLASSYLGKDGFNVVVAPRFSDVDIDGKIRTAIRFYVVEYEGNADFGASTPKGESTLKGNSPPKGEDAEQGELNSEGDLSPENEAEFEPLE